MRKTFHLEYWLILLPQPVTFGFYFFSSVNYSSKIRRDLRLTNKFILRRFEAFKSPMWVFQHHRDCGSLQNIYICKRKKKRTPQNARQKLFIHLLFKVKPVSLRANGSISLFLNATTIVLSVGQKEICVPTELLLSAQASGAKRQLLCQSLVDVPDFGEQRRELLVLEAKGENLFRVDAA